MQVVTFLTDKINMIANVCLTTKDIYFEITVMISLIYREYHIRKVNPDKVRLLGLNTIV